MLSPGDLKDIFHFDPETGVLSWRERHSNSVPEDLRAGYINSNGYISIMFERRSYLAHRIVWAIVHGDWPTGHIDHINGMRADNRPCNLRDVTPAENKKNSRLYKRNKSGVSGVSWVRNAWEASIRVEGRLIYLGRFKDFDSAVRVRMEAQAKFDFHPNHGLAA